MASEREVVARAIYEAMYAEIGGDWNAVETKDVWRAKADAVLSALSDRSRYEVGGDVRAQCLSVFKAARDGGMQVPTVAGAWIPVCTAALDSLLAAWSPILAADAERRVREECAKADWSAMLAASPGGGRVTAEMVEKAAEVYVRWAYDLSLSDVKDSMLPDILEGLAVAFRGAGLQVEGDGKEGEG